MSVINGVERWEYPSVPLPIVREHKPTQRREVKKHDTIQVPTHCHMCNTAGSVKLVNQTIIRERDSQEGPDGQPPSFDIVERVIYSGDFECQFCHRILKEGV